MSTFQTKPTATVTANWYGQSGSVNVAGVTSGNVTLEDAATHLNTLLDVVGKSVSSDGMIRTLKQEGSD